MVWIKWEYRFGELWNTTDIILTYVKVKFLIWYQLNLPFRVYCLNQSTNSIVSSLDTYCDMHSSWFQHKLCTPAVISGVCPPLFRTLAFVGWWHWYFFILEKVPTGGFDTITSQLIFIGSLISQYYGYLHVRKIYILELVKWQRQFRLHNWGNEDCKWILNECKFIVLQILWILFLNFILSRCLE